MGKSVRLVLDNIIFFLQRSGGGSVYWSENIRRLDKAPFDITYLEPKGEHFNIFYKALRSALNHPFRKEFATARPLSFLGSRYDVQDAPFIFHSSYYRTANHRMAINIVTIHDFMPEMFFSGVKRFYHSWRKRAAIRKADGIVCVSSNTKEDLLRFYPEISKKKIVTIPLGISEDYFTISDKGSETSRGVPYLLYVGRRSHYKNFDFALAVLRALKGYKLVVAGEQWTDVEQAAITPFSGRIELVANPSNSQMNKLYNNAFCLLYPSSYEGFGIPVVEAMAAGCPVVALEKSSIPEVSGGAGLLLPELDVTLFTDAVLSLENNVFRQQLINGGMQNASRYNWDRSVSQLTEFYLSVYGANANETEGAGLDQPESNED